MNPLYRAALSHFEGKRHEAIATLDAYFNRSVGIGEHSGLLNEISKWSEVLANSTDCLEALRRDFSEEGKIK